MKNIFDFKKLLILCNLFIVVSSIALGQARIGGDGSGGGDEVGLEFQKLGEQAFNFLSRDLLTKAELSLYLKFDLSKVKYLVVDSELPVDLSNKEKQNSAAICDRPSSTIFISRQRISKISSISRRKSLALHELLCLANIEQTGDYHVSSKVNTDEDFVGKKDLVSQADGSQCPVFIGPYLCVHSYQGTLEEVHRNFSYKVNEGFVQFTLPGIYNGLEYFIADDVQRTYEFKEFGVTVSHQAFCDNKRLVLDYFKHPESHFTNKYVIKGDVLVIDTDYEKGGINKLRATSVCIPKDLATPERVTNLTKLVKSDSSGSCEEIGSSLQLSKLNFEEEVAKQFSTPKLREAQLSVLQKSLRLQETLNNYCQKDCASDQYRKESCQNIVDDSQRKISQYVVQKGLPLLSTCTPCHNTAASKVIYTVFKYDQGALVDADVKEFGSSSFVGHPDDLRREVSKNTRVCQSYRDSDKNCQ